MTDRPNADDYRNRAERAEAECRELRERLAATEALTRLAQDAAMSMAFQRNQMRDMVSFVGFPQAFDEQACTISKSGRQVTIECAKPEHANGLFEWIADIAATCNRLDKGN